MGKDTSEKGATDRRVWLRSPVTVREARCLAGMEVFFGIASNVSRGGMFISSARRRSLGEVFEIQFRLPGLPREMRCRARVVWVRLFRAEALLPPGFGLHFLDLPEGDARAIEDWVSTMGGLESCEDPK